MKLIMSVLKEAAVLYWHLMQKPAGVAVFLGVVTATYSINIWFRDEPAHPLWGLWFAVSSTFFYVLSQVIYDRYLSKKEDEFKEALENGVGSKWMIHTSDHVKIGEINEKDYLTAKHEADVCMTTKLLQVLNVGWIMWVTFARFLAALPVMLIAFMVVVAIAMPPEELMGITLGQVLVHISEGWGVIVSLLLTVLVVFLGVHMVVYQSFPGYKDFYSLRLKRLLAQHVPNIANADGYSVTAYKIDDVVATEPS